MGGAAIQLHDDDAPEVPYSRAELLRPRSGPRGGVLPCPPAPSPPFRGPSRGVPEHFLDVLYACRNLACGCTFKATLSIECILTPSGIPDPDCTIPFRPLPRVAGVTVGTEPLDEPDPDQPGLFD